MPRAVHTDRKPAGAPAETPPAPVQVWAEALRCDTRFQMREALDPVTVKNYANALEGGAVLPPVHVVDVEGALYIVDGFHRVAAFRRIRERTGKPAKIAAVVTPGTLRDALRLAAVANLRHGRPLNRREIRRAFNAFVTSAGHRNGHEYRSYREIAAALGGAVRHTTIRNWMREDHPNIARAMGGGDDPPYNGEQPRWDHIDTWALEGVQRAGDEVLKAITALPEPLRVCEAKRLAGALKTAAVGLYGDWPAEPAPDPDGDF